MATFTFQLEGVLRHRKHVEQQRQRDLAVAQKRVNDLQADLVLAQQALQAATEDLRRNHLVGRLDLNFLAAHRRFTAAAEARMAELRQRIGEAEQAVAAARLALADAAKQRRILEKLREKQHARYVAARAKSESAQLDELSAQLASRHSSS